MSVVSGCGAIKNENTTTPSSLTSINSTPISIASSSIKIDKDDVSTWPRFEFKELGFSVQLPFATNDVEGEYSECGKGKFYHKKDSETRIMLDENGCDVRSDYFNYFAWSKKYNFAFLYSFVGLNYEGGELGDTLVSSTDLMAHAEEYEVDGFSFAPSKIIQNEGVKFIVIGQFKRRKFIDPDYETIGFAFNLKIKQNLKFRTALFSFCKSELSEKQLIDLIKTIKFSSYQ
jgi:hypothetical protein